MQAVGSLGSDPIVFWKDLKKVDLGVNGNSANLIVWNGEQSSAVVNRSFGLNAAPNAEVTLELARIGNELVLFSGARELGRVADPGVYSRNQVRFGLLAGKGNEIIMSSLKLATRAGAETTAQVTRFVARTAARSGEGLRDLPGARDFMIGASVVTSRFESESARNTLGREFNMLVAGNAMKWESLQPEPGRFAFCEADQLMEFAAANGQQVRGHVLVWGLQLSSWVERGTWTRETLLAAMRAHIQAVVGRYRGKIFAWDVVNEALEDAAPHNLKQNVFSRVLGQDYIDFAFRYAREADPNVKLFYNEYGGERMNSKSQAVFNMVSAMKARGVPIDGVGLQMHYGLTGVMPAG